MQRIVGYYSFFFWYLPNLYLPNAWGMEGSKGLHCRARINRCMISDEEVAPTTASPWNIPWILYFWEGSLRGCSHDTRMSLIPE